MTAPAPETIEREKDKLFLDDAALIRRLGVPEKIMRARLPVLQAKHRFPQKDPLFGDRYFWPAVEEWFRKRYSLIPKGDPDDE